MCVRAGSKQKFGSEQYDSQHQMAHTIWYDFGLSLMHHGCKYTIPQYRRGIDGHDV